METKPGWKTTEFWLTLCANLLGAMAASGAFPESSPTMKAVGMGGAVLATMGYTYTRAQVKQNGGGK